MTQTRIAKPEAPAPLAAHVLRVYALASDAHLKEGARWYAEAYLIACELDPSNPRRAAGVLAALSPRCNWPRNVVLARRAYAAYLADPTADHYASGVLGNSCRAADRILRGEDPSTVLKAPKVKAFFGLISNPDDRGSVCVDRHAIDVAVATRHDDDTRTALYPLDRRGWYERFAVAYRLAAHILGVTPAHVQAVTWLTWRDLALETRRGFAMPRD